jgi:hypothetical protein
LGYRIDRVQVSGRSRSDNNARVIDEALANLPAVNGARIILLGYSKGVVDILHFLVNYPIQATRVSAMISVAEAVNGSSLADMAAPWDAMSGAYVPLAPYASGDHCVIEDLPLLHRWSPSGARTCRPSHSTHVSQVAALALASGVRTRFQ